MARRRPWLAYARPASCRRSRAATATASSCSVGSRTDEHALHHQETGLARRRRRRDGNRRAVHSLHAAGRDRYRSARKGSRHADGGAGGFAAAHRSGLPAFHRMRRLRRPASASRRLPAMEARQGRARVERHCRRHRRLGAVCATHTPPRRACRPAHRHRHAAWLPSPSVAGNHPHRGMPDLAAGDRCRARSLAIARRPGLRHHQIVPHGGHGDGFGPRRRGL